MNEQTSRGLLVAGLSTNVLFLALALLDYSNWDSQYQWPIFVGWAFLIILLVVLALVSTGIRVEVVQERRVAERVVSPAPVERIPVAPQTAPKAAAKVAAEPFPFTYGGYTLYTRSVELKNGGERAIWFFSKRIPSSGKPAGKPAGFHVGVNERTGLPFLKRGVGQDGEDLTPEIEHSLRPQCAALTEDDKQCRNSARADSKYCASHFGYQPPVISKATVSRTDTRARVPGAPDTKPAARKRTVA
ncbi:MAG: hypothetical protein AABY18_08330 [Candidatus Thermoplasmatota archaeon]